MERCDAIGIARGDLGDLGDLVDLVASLLLAAPSLAMRQRPIDT